MQSAFNRIVQAFRRKRPMSAARTARVRREARDFATQLLETYALQTVRQPIRPLRRH